MERFNDIDYRLNFFLRFFLFCFVLFFFLFVLLWFVSCDLQIRQLQEVAKDLEARMNRVLDDIKRKENDLDKVRRDLRNTSPDDAAYVSSETAPVFFFSYLKTDYLNPMIISVFHVDL